MDQQVLGAMPLLQFLYPRLSAEQLQRELEGLDQEFAHSLRWNSERQELHVTTGVIYMQDQYKLGRCRIFWLVGVQAQQRRPFFAARVEPQEGEYLNPHASLNSFCLGAGDRAMSRALEQARLLDATLILQGVLSTYSSAEFSRPVKTKPGVPCFNCGQEITQVELNQYSPKCTACGKLTCRDCRVTCDLCRKWVCKLCIRPNPYDQRDPDRYCPSCLSKAPEHRPLLRRADGQWVVAYGSAALSDEEQSVQTFLLEEEGYD